MRKILLFGSGKSATVLIEYLLANAATENWMVIVVDADINLAQSKIDNSAFGKAISFDINDADERNKIISESDIVISMLPPTLHTIVAKSCINNNKNLLTASYIDDEIRNLQSEIENRNLLFLCEMGLDPGIDHMSAMKMIDDIHKAGGKINSFKSHCGGLVAPESDDNPWHYKISWNPRNILMAGKSGAVYKSNGHIEKLAYYDLFAECPAVSVPGLNDLVCYPNRDSLSYIPVYGLQETSTFIRTTLRHHDFCIAWNYIVQAGLTDETKPGKEKLNGTIQKFIDNVIEAHTGSTGLSDYTEKHVKQNDRLLVKKLFEFLGLFSDDNIPAKAETAADVMQTLLEKKLSLHTGDKDMIVMLHEIDFENSKKHIPNSRISSSLVVKGENNLKTAMAKTVGLPLGIAAKLILNGTINLKGLHIPTKKEIYEPVLNELGNLGIKFHEEIKQLA